MNIRINKYFIEQEPNNPTLFNLFEVKVRSEKSKSSGEEHCQELAWGVSLERAIELLTHHVLCDNDVTVSLGEFVKEYRNQVSLIKELLKSNNYGEQ